MTDNQSIVRGTILFVDDERDILSALKRLTRSVKADCLFANSGNEALELMQQQPVDEICVCRK